MTIIIIFIGIYILGVGVAYLLGAIYNDYVCPDHDKPLPIIITMFSWIGVLATIIGFFHPNGKNNFYPTFKKKK